MPEGKTFSEMCLVESKDIQVYTKSRLFFSSLQSWKRDSVFEFTLNTKMIGYSNNSGQGWVMITGLKDVSNEQTL